MINYVSIDLETTGLNPDYCQILEFGAVIYDGSKYLDDLPIFAAYIINEPVVGDTYALQMNSAILKHIALKDANWSHHYLKPEELAPRFRGFLENNGLGSKDKITIAGKNYGTFDARFLEKMPGWNDIIAWRHRILDPGMLYWNQEVDGYVVPDMKTCQLRAEMPPIVQHNAIDDAIDVIKLIQKYIERKKCQSNER
jgi:DNA polymerase III alpha subunit (gram-positive type)